MAGAEDSYTFVNIDNENRLTKERRSEVEKLAGILSVERATDHSSWVDVGYCLHSLSREFSYLFKTFSKKYERYKKGLSKRDCDKQWEYMNNTAKRNYTMGSLKYWARKDNPDGYEKIRKDSLETLIIKSIKKEKASGTHSDVANVIHKYYTDEFVCAGLKDNSWYYFDNINGKWRLTEQGHELRKRLSSDMIEIYEHYAGKFKLMKGDDPESDEYEKYDKYNTNCYTVILKLKDSNYKDKIMKECKEKFYDPKFMEKLNANVNLLGLDNCIVDLKHQVGEKHHDIIFREGRPDDYVSLSTGYELPIDKCHLPLSLDQVKNIIPKNIGQGNYDELNADLEDFVHKILPQDDVHDYTFRFLSS
jgi:hypothetical protein